LAILPEDRLKLRHFRLIVAIEDTGSMRKAAEELGITQPAASNALHELEYILGVSLFSRSRSGTEPTSFGKTLIKRGRFLLSNVRATADEIAQAKNGDVGEVHVGILPASALTILPLAIKRATETKPNITLHVIEGATGQLLPALVRGELDMVIGRIPATQIPENIDREELLAEPNEVVCRAGHPLAARGRLTLADLAEAKWILPEEGAHLRSDFHAAFVHGGLRPPDPIVLTSSTVLRLTLIETTDLLGMLTRRTALQNQERGTLAILDAKLLSPTPPTLLLTRADAIATPVASVFAELIREASKTLEG
jgi:DNA-binding transcriptional LysR family regulator